VETWIGTNATGGDDSDPSNDHQDGNNMNLVRADTYDGGTDKGNNLLTKITLHVDDSTVRETTYGYDWRDRQTSSLGPLGDYRSIPGTTAATSSCASAATAAPAAPCSPV